MAQRKASAQLAVGWHRLIHAGERLVDPIGRKMVNPGVIRCLAVLPAPPRWLRRRVASPATPWPDFDLLTVPAELKTQPGIGRNREEEDAAHKRQPLQQFEAVHPEAIAWAMRSFWPSFLPVAGRMSRVRARARTVAKPPSHVVETRVDAQALKTELVARAAELGIGAIGVAEYDERYTFVQHAARDHVGDRVIVCALEQNFEATQRIPSALSERAALSAYAELQDKCLSMIDVLLAAGFRARVAPVEGHAIVHHYAVEAGLGQLGLNGQVLTPAAGSRCRLILVHTDAPLPLDGPVDYGIEGICDNCQACVRRCPSGAIPATRSWHRGVKKAKLNTKRCFPVIVQSHGCSICMKVCPIQKYGLPAVLKDYEATGTIVGTGTDELEAYRWTDGRQYAAHEHPRLDRAYFQIEGFEFDASRKLPRD